MRPPLISSFVVPFQFSSGPSFLFRKQLCPSRRQLQHSFFGFEDDTHSSSNNSICDLNLRHINTRCVGKKLLGRFRNYPSHFSASHLTVSRIGEVSSTEAPRCFRGEIELCESVQTRSDSEYRRCFSSQAKDPRKFKKRRSPYAVLGLRKKGSSMHRIITHDEIKLAFRKLAKIYHPDLNPENRSIEECEALMSELLEAYERLMRTETEEEEDFLENIRVGTSNKVALACELYSVEELMMDNFHEVYSLRIEYRDEKEEKLPSESELGSRRKQSEVPVASNALPQTAKSFATPVEAHPGDSVLDLKQELESRFGNEWGLMNCLGWELLALKKKRSTISDAKDDSENCAELTDEEDLSIVAFNNDVLSYHLFLEDYKIQHGDTIYAVVRKTEN